MFDEIVSLTHNDLDALGCMLHLRAATTKPIKTFNTNYQDIESKVSDVYDYVMQNDVKLLLISDVSFSQNKAHLLQLQELQSRTKVVFIDHHEYTSGFFDDITITYIHDITKSATKLVQEFLGTKGKHETLDRLSDIINDYDIWKEDSPLFKTGISLNVYFWESLQTMSIEYLAESIIANNYHLPHNFARWYKKYAIDSKAAIENYKRKKLIVSDGHFAVCFVDEYFNEILYEEFQRGTTFVLIANSYGIMRFRFNSKKLNRKLKEEIKMKLIGTLDIGHLNAFSDKIQNSNFDKIMDKVKEVHDILHEYKN